MSGAKASDMASEPANISVPDVHNTENVDTKPAKGRDACQEQTAKQDEEDEDSDEGGGAALLLRLGVALARGNRNDDAAVSLRKAIALTEDESMAFEAEENFLVVINRLFQPIDSFMMFRNRELILALDASMRAIAPKIVLDVGSGSCAAVASMLAARHGARRVLLYETLKVRTEVVQDILKANGLQKQVRVVKQDFLMQPEATAPQRENPADTMIVDVHGSLGHDLFNSELVPTLLHARDGLFLSPDVRVVPSAVRLVFVVVESVGIQELEEVRQLVDGYDLRAFNKFARHTRTIQLASVPHRALCAAVRSMRVDLQALARGERGGVGETVTHRLDITQSGDAHGLVYWYEVETEPGRPVSLGPEAGPASAETVWILGQGGEPPRLEPGVGATVTMSVSREGSLELSLVPGTSDGEGAGREHGEAGSQGGAEGEGEGDGEGEGEDPFTQCRGIPLYHFSMINDLSRAAAYSGAIAAALAELPDAGGVRVLDVGCGSGLLSLMAAGHGAGEVHGCDKAPGMAAVARRVVAANGMEGRVTVHDALSTSMAVGAAEALRGRVDLLISETFGDDPFSESFLPSLAHARQHLLHPHARVVPEGLVVYAVVIESQELLELNGIEGGGPLVDTVGLDLSAWACFGRRRWSCRLPDHACSELTPVFEALTVDWSAGGDGESPPPVPLEGEREVRVGVSRGGTAHAVAAWYTLELHRGAGVRLSTDPASAAMQGRHWRQAVYFLPPAQRTAVAAGQQLALAASFRRDRLSFRLLP